MGVTCQAVKNFYPKKLHSIYSRTCTLLKGPLEGFPVFMFSQRLLRVLFHRDLRRFIGRFLFLLVVAHRYWTCNVYIQYVYRGRQRKRERERFNAVSRKKGTLSVSILATPNPPLIIYCSALVFYSHRAQSWQSRSVVKFALALFR